MSPLHQVERYLSTLSLRPATLAIHRQHLAGLLASAVKDQRRLGLLSNPWSLASVAFYLQWRKPTAKVRAWQVLKRFFVWLKDAGLIEALPLVDLPCPARPRARNFGLTDDQLSAWLAALEVRPLPLRLRALVWMALGYGLSSQELLDAKRENWRPPFCYIYRTKTDQPRIIQPENVALEKFKAWIEARDHRFGSTGFLFCNLRGLRLKDDALRNQIRKLKAKHHLVGTEGLHQFRHTMARLLAERGVALIEISRFFGHRNLRSTDNYLRGHFGTITQVGAEVLSIFSAGGGSVNLASGMTDPSLPVGSDLLKAETRRPRPR